MIKLFDLIKLCTYCTLSKFALNLNSPVKTTENYAPFRLNEAKSGFIERKGAMNSEKRSKLMRPEGDWIEIGNDGIELRTES